MSTEAVVSSKARETKNIVKGSVEVGKRREPVSKKRLEKPSRAISDDMRTQLIAEAAYFRSLKRNFAPGYEQEDWLSAEQEIDHQFASSSRD